MRNCKECPIQSICIDYGQKDIPECVCDRRVGFYDSRLSPSVKELLRSVDKTHYDAVEHPSHYNKGKVECIDAIETAVIGLEGIEAVCTANAIKYLWRWKQKGGTEDLKKARWYINKLLGEEPNEA